MNPIEHILSKFPIMVLDGAMATELEEYGCDLNDRLWSAKVLMEKPELIKQVHTDYFKVGADCAITASYQATVKGFIERGLTEEEAEALLAKSVQLATQARDEFWANQEVTSTRPKPLVAASVGPYGAFLADGSEYRGDYQVTEEELVIFHRKRMKILIEAGADLLACETIPCLLEAKAITRVLHEFPGVYAWISFSAKDGKHISSGEKIADGAKWLEQQEQIAAIGVNCTAPTYINSLVREVKSQSAKPIIIYPNSGEEYDASNKTWNHDSAGNSFSGSIPDWYESGARIIGGCCRTNPKDIERIVAWARENVR